jgi:glucokinase
VTIAYPLLVADIGGTNCRVGVVDAAGRAPRRLETVPTAAAATAADALADVARRHGLVPQAVALAVAGVVQRWRAELTNSAWTFDIGEICRRLGVSSGLLANDFAALAASLPTLPPDLCVSIAGGEADPDGTRLVLGPGTGFGVAALAPHPGGHVIVASEAGHVALGPETDAEAAFWPHLPRDARITYEALLCGSGLGLLDAALMAASDRRAIARDAATITAAAGVGDTDAQAAITAFLDLLARVTGDLALAFKATGGVWLAGGVAQRLAPFIDAARFTRLMRRKPPMEPLLQVMSCSLITAPDAAERGLAALAAAPSAFGMRLWTP